MTSNLADLSPRRVALVAGFGLLIMTIAAVWADFAVFSRLIVPEDAAATAQNIAAHGTAFRLGIAAFFVVIVADVVVAWAFYVFLKRAGESLSLLTAWFRLMYATVFGLALLGLVTALRLLGGADYLNTLGTSQLHTDILLAYHAFEDGWAIGYVFFALHLVLLGFLVFRSGYVPKLLGVLLVIAGLGYGADKLGVLLVPDYALNIALYTFIGEPLLMLWLFWRGGRGERGKARPLARAPS